MVEGAELSHSKRSGVLDELPSELETAFAYSNEIPICRDSGGELGKLL